MKKVALVGGGGFGRMAAKLALAASGVLEPIMPHFGDVKPAKMEAVQQIKGTHKIKNDLGPQMKKKTGGHRRQYLSGKPLFRKNGWI